MEIDNDVVENENENKKPPTNILKEPINIVFPMSDVKKSYTIDPVNNFEKSFSVNLNFASLIAMEKLLTSSQLESSLQKLFDPFQIPHEFYKSTDTVCNVMFPLFKLIENNKVIPPIHFRYILLLALKFPIQGVFVASYYNNTHVLYLLNCNLEYVNYPKELVTSFWKAAQCGAVMGAQYKLLVKLISYCGGLFDVDAIKYVQRSNELLSLAFTICNLFMFSNQREIIRTELKRKFQILSCRELFQNQNQTLNPIQNAIQNHKLERIDDIFDCPFWLVSPPIQYTCTLPDIMSESFEKLNE